MFLSNFGWFSYVKLMYTYEFEHTWQGLQQKTTLIIGISRSLHEVRPFWPLCDTDSHVTPLAMTPETSIDAELGRHPLLNHSVL